MLVFQCPITEWLVMAEFAFNNKVHTVSSPFKVNYERKPRIGFNIRKKRKYVKVEEFVKEIRDRHEETKVALVKSQEEIKRYVDRNKKEIEKYKVGDKVLISCHMQVHLSGNNVPAVKPLPNYTSLPSTAATFLATRLMAVLQLSGYSVFHDGDTPIQLGLP